VDYPDNTAKIYHYENSDFSHHLTGISYVDTSGITSRYATYTYDANGRAISTEHAGGIGRFTLSYDSETQTTVHDAIDTSKIMGSETQIGIKNLVSNSNQVDNKSLHQTFDANNNLTCKQDEEGNITTYTYNSHNQKMAMTEGQAGSCAALQSTAATRTTTYQYLSDSLDIPTVIESPSVRIGERKRTTVTYGDTRFPTLPTKIVQSGFTPGGNPLSRTTAFVYNNQGQVTKVDGPRTDVTDSTILVYNDCTTGGSCGQLKSLTNALGHLTTYDTYDASGRLLQMTDPNGLKTSYEYDLRGRVKKITETPPTGNPRVTSYTYTTSGDVASVHFPDNRTLTYTYDAARMLKEVRDNLDNIIKYEYDKKGNHTKETTHDVSGTLVETVVRIPGHIHPARASCKA